VNSLYLKGTQIGLYSLYLVNYMVYLAIVLDQPLSLASNTLSEVYKFEKLYAYMYIYMDVHEE